MTPELGSCGELIVWRWKSIGAGGLTPLSWPPGPRIHLSHIHFLFYAPSFSHSGGQAGARCSQRPASVQSGWVINMLSCCMSRRGFVNPGTQMGPFRVVNDRAAVGYRAVLWRVPNHKNGSSWLHPPKKSLNLAWLKALHEDLPLWKYRSQIFSVHISSIWVHWVQEYTLLC